MAKTWMHFCFCIVVAIAWKTGQVLAWEVLPKHCMGCKLKEDMNL